MDTDPDPTKRWLFEEGKPPQLMAAPYPALHHDDPRRYGIPEVSKGTEEELLMVFDGIDYE